MQRLPLTLPVDEGHRPVLPGPVRALAAHPTSGGARAEPSLSLQTALSTGWLAGRVGGPGEDGHDVSVPQGRLAGGALELARFVPGPARPGPGPATLRPGRVQTGGGGDDLGRVVSRLQGHHAGHDHEEATRAENYRARERDVAQVQSALLELAGGVVVELPRHLQVLLVLSLVGEVANHSERDPGDDEGEPDGDGPAGVPQTPRGHPALPSPARHEGGGSQAVAGCHLQSWHSLLHLTFTGGGI